MVMVNSRGKILNHFDFFNFLIYRLPRYEKQFWPILPQNGPFQNHFLGHTKGGKLCETGFFI